jgi:hypothetical protein
MRKQRIEYNTSVDALVAVAKLLSIYEGQYNMMSEEFYDKFIKGKMDDSEDFIEWANNYQHYLDIRQEVDIQIRHAG